MENGQRYRAKLSVRLGVTFSRQKRIFHHAFCNVRSWRSAHVKTRTKIGLYSTR